MRKRNGVPACTCLAMRFHVACRTAELRTSARASAVTLAGYRLFRGDRLLHDVGAGANDPERRARIGEESHYRARRLMLPALGQRLRVRAEELGERGDVGVVGLAQVHLRALGESRA